MIRIRVSGNLGLGLGALREARVDHDDHLPDAQLDAEAELDARARCAEDQGRRRRA